MFFVTKLLITFYIIVVNILFKRHCIDNKITFNMIYNILHLIAYKLYIFYVEVEKNYRKTKNKLFILTTHNNESQHCNQTIFSLSPHEFYYLCIHI